MAIQDVNVVGDTDSLLRDMRNLLGGRNITTASSGVISLGGHLYSASITGLVPAGGATDIFTITTAATTPAALRLKKIVITGTTGDDLPYFFKVVVRSTINTGGTSTSPTVMAWNGTPSSVTVATVMAYTANPAALGTLTGELMSQHTSTVGASVGANVFLPVVFDFGPHGFYTQTANTVIAVNAVGMAAPAGNLSVYAIWSESES